MNETRNNTHSYPDPRRITERGTAGRYIARHHAAGTDQRIVANAYTGQDNRATTDPDITPDMHRPTELKPCFTLSRFARMIGSEDLHTRADLRSVTDADGNDIKDHAIEVEKNAFA